MEAYRVVYSEDILSGKYFVDIAPKSDSVCHQDIMLERQKHNLNAHDRAGSVILYDMGEGREPELKFYALKDNLLLSDYYQFNADMLPLISKRIKQAFKEMRDAGKVRNIEVNFEDRFDIFCNICGAASGKNNKPSRSSYDERKEKILESRQHRQKIAENKSLDEKNKKAFRPEILMAWKQACRSGD